MKRAWIAAGLLCVHAHAEEAGFPAIRVGDAWVYSGYNDDDGLRSRPVTFRVDLDGETPDGDLVPVHRDPRLSDDQQIGQVLDPVPPGTCVADLLAGIEVLPPAHCTSPPRVGSAWSQELPSADNRRVRLELRYSGRKQLRVPAGRFETYRFDVEQVTSTASSDSRLRRVYWYSPDVRGMVALEIQPVDLLGRRAGPKTRVELTTFTTSPDAAP